MTSTALHTAARTGVQRAPKHPTLRRFATTWGRAAIIAIAFGLQLLILVAVLTFLADWSSAILAIQTVLALVVLLFLIHHYYRDPGS